MVYVGSAQDSQLDQVLDEILVGPVPVGINKFVLQVQAPNLQVLPVEEVLGVTVVLVTCSYKEREFVRVGYYVNNEYQYSVEELDKYQQAVTAMVTQQQQQQQVPLQQQEGEGNEANTTVNNNESDNNQPPPPIQLPQLPPPPLPLDFAKVQRHILADKPRVTKFPIPWTLNDITNLTNNNSNNNNNNNTNRASTLDHVKEQNGHYADEATDMDTSLMKMDDDDHEGHDSQDDNEHAVDDHHGDHEDDDEEPEEDDAEEDVPQPQVPAHQEEQHAIPGVFSNTTSAHGSLPQTTGGKYIHEDEHEDDDDEGDNDDLIPNVEAAPPRPWNAT